MPFLEFITSNLKPIASIAGGALSFLGSERRNRAEAASARQQMDFQRQMSNTAVQRQIRDMQAAGINPILSAKYGGASTPAGAMAKPENSFEKAIHSAFQVAQLQQTQANVKKMESETKLTDAKAVIEEQKGSDDFGTYIVKRLKKEITKIDKQSDLINSQHEGQRLKNTYDQWANNWYYNTFKAPKAALTAKFENFLFSTGLSGVSKKQVNEYQKNVNKAFEFVNKKFSSVVNDPKLLERIYGGVVAGFVMKTVSDAATGIIKQLLNTMKKNKGKQKKGNN